jgi:hypothetical protein
MRPRGPKILTIPPKQHSEGGRRSEEVGNSPRTLKLIKVYFCLLEKGKKIAAKVQADYLPRHYSQVVYWNTNLPGMGCSVPVAIFLEDELHHIQSTPIQVIPPDMGYIRKMLNAVVFGTSRV